MKYLKGFFLWSLFIWFNITMLGFILCIASAPIFIAISMKSNYYLFLLWFTIPVATIVGSLWGDMTLDTWRRV